MRLYPGNSKRKRYGKKKTKRMTLARAWRIARTSHVTGEARTEKRR